VFQRARLNLIGRTLLTLARHSNGREDRTQQLSPRSDVLDHSDVTVLVAPLRDALGQRHSLWGRLLLSAFDGTLSITAGTLERAILEPSTVRIQEAGHALSEALGFGALARVLAGRPVAAKVGSAEQSLRGNALGRNAFRHWLRKRRGRLLHTAQQALLTAARARHRTVMGLGALSVSHACFHIAAAFVRCALASLLASSRITIHIQHTRRAEVGQALALDALHKRSCKR